MFVELMPLLAGRTVMITDAREGGGGARVNRRRAILLVLFVPTTSPSCPIETDTK